MKLVALYKNIVATDTAMTNTEEWRTFLHFKNISYERKFFVKIS